MTPRQARHALAMVAQTGLGDPWAAHASPPESVSAPALVVAPRPPYRVKGTVCAEEVRVTMTLLVSRNSSEDGLDLLDDSITAVRDVIHSSVDFIANVDAVQDIGIIQEVGGIEYLAATLDITMEV